ncbi:MAG: endo-1,4-beta-xylanase [Methylobacteriaceae bacterium]|nr:endo-1,4-beta-xylanase [Methylobacteriaceae bacterium]
MISRRDLLAGAAASAAQPLRAVEPETLASAAARAGLVFGASIDAAAFDDPAYFDLYRRETQLLVTDVALKFDWLRPAEDVWNFAPADRIVAAAKAEGKLVRGHTLIWNDNAPAWLKKLSGREIERVFDEHIDRVAARYAGALHSWDVVNEPFWPIDRRAGGWRDGPWFAAMGSAYVERAFRRVAAVDKTARLTLNEAQCDNDGDWGRSIRPLLAGLVDRLRDAGAPLHAIGLESHLQPKFPHNYKEFARYVADFGAQDLEVYISEFDVDDSVYPDSAAERDAAAAALAGEFLSNVLAVPAVRLIATWQLSDRYSWYRSLPRKHMFGPARMPRPLPFDDDGRPKPMRQAMIEAFRARAAGAGRPTP